ncbi:HNH endonuclease [Sphingobacterium hotanense]|uniref:HNH endonuclease n=1 Tax=Sphingobacterium hotanense TaxID=649196 RepID=A0ABT7NST9_9SPHI|nr:hypothetical protein [Sphingobacterium hotanense]MDM1050206.1 HNH endonuclease [Sphingobacterium hotanense]
MTFSEEELQLIQNAKDEGGDIWNNERLSDLKSKIKKYYQDIKDVCCYCRRNLQDEFKMVIDIEHVLPKSKYAEYMFELGNLNISCKRCNMRIKREKDDFIVDTLTIRNNYALSSQYRIIHPNFDLYIQNMNVLRFEYNDIKLTKYKPITEKGKFTYNYFELKKLEVNSLNDAQGITTISDDSVESEGLTDNLKDELENLLAKL